MNISRVDKNTRTEYIMEEIRGDLRCIVPGHGLISVKFVHGVRVASL